MQYIYNKKDVFFKYRLFLIENKVYFDLKKILNSNVNIKDNIYNICSYIYKISGVGGYILRSIFGGAYNVLDVIQKGPNCVDYSVFLQYFLKKELNINSTLKITKLGFVKKHYYLLTEQKYVLDLIVGIPQYPNGFFLNEKVYLAELKKINNLGIITITKQIKAILMPFSRKKLI